jgi:hypothetical protein
MYVSIPSIYQACVLYTGVPPYPMIQYLRFQLSKVYRSPGKILKLKK